MSLRDIFFPYFHFLNTLKTLIYIKPYFHDSLQAEMSTSKVKKRSIEIGQALHHDPALRMSCGADLVSLHQEGKKEMHNE